VPPITFPESLPVSGRREEIAQALQTHQVVIVCGETGSGKTTQLPKIALALGRGLGAGGSGLIGHTQPRRIAASSVAKRIAEELNSPLGEVVGYKVRFNDRLQPGASVKLMTDGILLAETQTDPLLKAYDTIIIDEAHERSLNIDFLLGYLRQILPRRPDLKIIVTSATIDADRFAQHFASAKGPAPIISSAAAPSRWSSATALRREQGVRPQRRHRRRGGRALARGAGRHPGLPARRARDPRGGRPPAQAPGAAMGRSRILPLFARLSQAEQDRVFSPGNGRRIVLATNVAETSLTVPGIRYVIDSGLARVKRYSYRNKVEQLQIEPSARPRPTSARAAAAGWPTASASALRREGLPGPAALHRPGNPALLAGRRDPAHEVAAPGRGGGLPLPRAPPRRRLPTATAAGRAGRGGRGQRAHRHRPELSKLPLDPRVGRMILEARDRQSLTEVLIIASALSGRTCATGRWSSSRPPTRSTRSSTTRSRSSWATSSSGSGSRKAAASMGTGRRPARRRTATSSATASRRPGCARASSTRAACASGATSTASCTPWWPSTAGA
jgi:ATP-dependent helicase HrpA